MKRLYNKSSLLLVFLTLFISSGVFSQASLYTPYSFTTGGATAFPAGTSVSFGAVALQDENVIVLTPGFNFQCGGAVYSNFLVSTNGWVACIPSPAIPAYFATALPANSLSGYAGGTPLIAPMWDDIASTTFVWSVVGTDLYIRWNSKMPKTGAGGYSFGVKLSAAGAITFIYPTSVYNMSGAGANSASIGYASGCGEFYSFTPTTATTATVSDATEFSNALSQIVTTISGTAGNPTVNVGSSAGIVNGLFIGGIGIAAGGATVANVVGNVVTASANNTAALSGNGYFYMRPNNIQYVLNPTMNANDLCANATSLGTITAACTYITSSNAHNTQTSASGPSCAVTDTGDVWFSFIKPLGVTAVTVTTAPLACPLAMTGTSVELYASCGGAALACATTSIANPTYGEVSASRPCAAETLYVRVTGDNNKYGKFQICAKIGSVSNLGFTCSSAQALCSLPISIPGNTAGAGNEYDSTNAVCHTISMNGEDFVYTYTPTVNECVTITGTTAGPSIGISVYNGCPDSTGGAVTYCLRTAESITGSATITSVTMTAGVTYYIVIDSQSGSIAYNLNLSSGAGTPPNDLCGSATNLGTIASGVTCSYTTYTTACATPSPAVPNPAGVPAPTCVPNQVPRAFIDGVTGDVWIRFAAGYTGTLQIATVQSAVNPTANAAMAVYTGACAALTLAACDYNSGVNGMPLLSIPVSNGVTYYIRIWSENPEDAGQFDICFSSNCAPPNDAPCSAVNVPLGSTTSGYNTCAGITGEPLNAAQCVTGGTINTVWYSAVVPASGQIHVRTHPLTLTDTQIQGFTFASGCANAATTSVSRGCNDDGPNCSGGFQDFSDQNFTGLTPGDILYIAVDGTNSLTGSFEITFIDGTAPSFPPVPQQDCLGAQVICSTSNVTVADPGFRNYGNICDLATGANTCWAVGERNSVWYTFTTSGTGKVKFDITTPSSTDIDFIIWDVTGVSNPCGLIQSSSLSNAGCSFAGALSSTGLMDPPLSGGYANSINVTGTRTFILLLNSYQNTINAGFGINWQGTPIAAAGTVAIWSGGTVAADTLFSCNTCWGDCGSAPTCGVDATVNPVSNLRQPCVTVNSSVRDITINAGATLRIKAGVTLSVCGNFTNNGTLICEPGSTVQFQLGSAIQTISGNFTGANSFANLTINKSAGYVILNNNIDVLENFTTSTNTSQFNINGKYMKVGGNFTNANGTATFLIANLGNSRVEFNGTANQNFTNTAGTFNLNRMIMNKPSGVLYLMGANSSINIDTTLTLTSGVVNTRNVAANYIFLKWINAGAVTGYNATSYVDGKLRRQIYNFGYDARGMLLDWPVGDVVKGYQLANILFAPGGPTPGVSYLTGSFDSWPGFPPASGPVASECLFATYDILNLSDNGYWTFTRAATANYNGTYTMSLNNNNFTPQGQGWTVVVSDLANSPSNPASWRLAGSCITTSTQNLTRRSGINAVPAAADFFDLYFSTAISDQPLPIELLYFDATKTDKFVVCKWETATEINNDYFVVERSDDGTIFENIGEVKGFGAGTTTTNRSYSFTDDDVCNTIRYYRLKQVDIDRKFTYSNIVAVNCKATGDGIIVYPNPAVQNITCEFYQAKEDVLEISILDVTGRVIKSETYNAQKGKNASIIQIDDLSKGAYYLQIRGVNDLDNVAKRQQQFFKN